MRKRRVKPLPMPTEEDKARAKLKAVSADPLVWAMKSVDDTFPDTREKDIETIEAEAAIEEPTEPDADTEVEEDAKEPTEIKAEGKLAMPLDDGVVTMEVTPMRQDVSNVSPDELKSESEETIPPEDEAETSKKAHPVKGIGKSSAKSSAKSIKKSSEKTDLKTQVKLTALESKQKKLMFAFAALALLAIGGVGFGVVAMVKQSQTAAQLETELATVTESDDTVDGDFISLKDWNLKIKIISGLKNLSYNYQNDDYSSVEIWGAKQNLSANYTPDFAKQSNNSSALGTVIRIPRYERGAAGRLIWYDDYYNYYYQGPSGVPNVSEDEISWWVESYLLIKEMLTNADNYLSIEDSTISQN